MTDIYVKEVAQAILKSLSIKKVDGTIEGFPDTLYENNIKLVQAIDRHGESIVEAAHIIAQAIVATGEKE